MSREMKDSGVEWIGKIPDAWEMSKVKYFVSCLDGRRVPVDAALRNKGPYPYWGAGSIVDYVDKYIFNEDIILLGEDGAPFFDHTRPVAFLINEPVWVNNHIHVLKPKDTICAKYLVYWLNTVDYKSYINGSILNKLTQSNMNTISLAVPSIKEQKQISDFLDVQCAEIDSVLTRTRESIEEYKKLKQAVITQAVTKGIHKGVEMASSKREWIRAYPKHWKEIRIKWLLDERKEHSTEGREEPLSMSQKYGLIPTKEMDMVPNMAASFVGAKLAYKGDLVFNKLKAHLGVFAVSAYDGLVSPDYAVYYATGLANMKYLEYLFKTPQYIAEFKKKSTGVGAGLTRLYTAGLYSIYCALPPLDEQKEIADYLDRTCSEIDTLIAKKEQYLVELENYKKSLIYEYVTGKKEVR